MICGAPGAGCVHGENFPLRWFDRPNTLRLFQLWLNLPQKSKFAPPTFVMTWAENMLFLAGTGGAECEVAAGNIGGAAAGAPPPHSWAADDANEVGVFYITLPPGGAFQLPPAKHGAAINRAAYLVEGPTDPDSRVLVGGAPVLGGRGTLVLDASQPCLFENGNKAGTHSAHVLVLQGRPIGEPVVQHGPFVMNDEGGSRRHSMTSSARSSVVGHGRRRRSCFLANRAALPT